MGMSPSARVAALGCAALACGGTPPVRPATAPPSAAEAAPDAALSADAAFVAADAPCAGAARSIAPPGGSMSITGGGAVACAVRHDGVVHCWGDRVDFILDGATGPGPIEITGITSARCVAYGGGTACALGADGSVSCWGDSWVGHSGHRHRGVARVSGVTDATQIVAGQAQCALRRTGQVVCWRGDSWQPGPGKPLVPAVPIVGLDDAVELSVGRVWACARRATGVVSCWNLEDWEGPRFVPADVPEVTDAVALSVQEMVTIQRRDAGVVVWQPSPAAPQPLPGWDGAVVLAISNDYGCLLRPNGEVACGAVPRRPQDGSQVAAPVTVDGVQDVVAITRGSDFCALRADGEVLCWATKPGAVAAPIALPR